MISKWADAGAPRGNPADMPPARQFQDAAAWSIGTPDLIVSSSVHTLKAVAADYFGALETIPTGLTEDRYVKAAEVKEVVAPTNGSTITRTSGDLNLFTVHHAVITSRQRSRDGEDGPLENRGSEFNVVYEVGQNATIFPDVLGVPLRSGSVLNWDVHLHSIGAEVDVRIEVAFKFHPKGYVPKYQQTGSASFQRYDIDIPPGESNVRMDGSYTLSESGILATFEPHLHSSGKRMCVEAIYPNGIHELLNCAGYNHNWVKVYQYEDDVAPLLPKGTVLHVSGWYDNTANNPRVVDARNWKGYGQRSIDDMFGFLPRFIRLTDEQFKEEVARRQLKRSTHVTDQQQ
jgi:hypothetical protein